MHAAVVLSAALTFRSHPRFHGPPQEGAKLQLMQGQLNCGVELALMLVEAYEGTLPRCAR